MSVLKRFRSESKMQFYATAHTPLCDAVEYEIALLKGWRKSDNKRYRELKSAQAQDQDQKAMYVGAVEIQPFLYKESSEEYIRMVYQNLYFPLFSLLFRCLRLF